ncbi:MAG: hypothetical protein ACR2GY_00160 [Phycisphaerales bacterium]
MQSTATTRTSAFALAATMLLAATALPAAAQDRHGLHTIDDYIAQSDLVFHGEVTNIEYALSRPTGPEGSLIPHTFVTFRVHDVLHGSVADQHVTLRFMGGFNNATKRFMTISTGSLFDIGDEEVLFVHDNGHALTPIVGNQAGRLRVVDGQVYSDDGKAVMLDPAGAMVLGDRYALEEVITHDVAGRTFSIQLDASALMIDGPTPAMQCSDLLDRLAIAAAATAAPIQIFASADPQRAFDGPDYTPGRFNVHPSDIAAAEADPELAAEEARNTRDNVRVIRQPAKRD